MLARDRQLVLTRFWLRFTRFYWVLLGFTGFYWVLLGLTRFYCYFCRFYWVSLSFTGFCRVSLGFNRFYWVLMGLTGFDWVWLGLTWFLRRLHRQVLYRVWVSGYLGYFVGFEESSNGIECLCVPANSSRAEENGTDHSEGGTWSEKAKSGSWRHGPVANSIVRPTRFVKPRI